MIDFKRKLDSYRARVGEFRIVDVPALRYLMVDGRGDPNIAPAYADALAALYPMAYRLKFASRDELGFDYVVPPLEALWWADDLSTFTSARDKSRWQWTAMLMLPGQVTDAMVERARGALAATKAPAALGLVRIEELAEGRCVQTLHLGPYDDEGPVLAEMHERFIPDAGMTPTGRHHEIYLSDPRRTAPERLRTILRQPVL